MKRTGFFLFGGLVLGGIIHLAVILMLPNFATRDIWSRIAALDAEARMVVFEAPAPGEDNPMQLDPALIYGICRLSLADGPGVLNGTLPLGFWSAGVFDDEGHVVYSTTSRAHSATVIDMGLFTPAQMRMLANQSVAIADGAIIVEAQSEALFVVLRVAPPHDAVRLRYAQALEAMRCLSLT